MDTFEFYGFGDKVVHTNIRSHGCECCGECPDEGYFINDVFFCKDCAKQQLSQEDIAYIMEYYDVSQDDITDGVLSIEDIAHCLNWEHWEY